MSRAADERAGQASWHRLAAAAPRIADNTGHEGVLSPQEAAPGPSAQRLSERRVILDHMGPEGQGRSLDAVLHAACSGEPRRVSKQGSNSLWFHSASL